MTTSNTELLGTTTGMILTAIVAVVGLAVLLATVFLAAGRPETKRLKARRRGEVSGPTGKISAGQGDRPWEQIDDRD
jgi:hypothetical protein